MAGNSVIGALRVVLGADTAQLEKGLKDSQDSVASFGSSVSIGMAAVAAAVAAAAYSIAGSVKSVIASADHLNSLSQSTGVSVEQLSKLGYAAGLSGINMDSLSGSLGTLTKSMSKTAADGAGPASQAFAALGISVKNQDGTLRSSVDVLGQIADKFAGYRDGASKTALAIAIFGDAGAKLIPMLNQGSAGLGELGKEAETFGLVLDKRTTLAAAAFHENLAKLDAINQGLYTTIAAKLLPSLEALSSTYLDASKNSDLFMKAAQGIADIINAVIRGVLVAVVEINAMVTQVINLGSVIAKLWDAPKADWARLWGDYKSANDAVAASAEKAVSAIREAASAGDNGADWALQTQAVKALNREVVAYADAWKTAAPTITAATSNVLQNFLDSQAKRTAAQNAEADTVGKNVGEQAKLRLEYEANAIAIAKGIPLTEDYKAKIAAAGDAAGAAALKLQGMNLQQSLQTPEAQRTLQLQQYTAALKEAHAGTDAFAAANLKVNFPNFFAAKQAAMDFGAQIDQIATNSINGLASALTSVITGAKSAGEAFAAFGKQVLTWLVEMIVKALIFKAISFAIGFAGGGPVDAAQSLSSTGLSTTGTGGLYDVGGFTGVGGKLEPAGVVHKGEDVFSQDDVARWGGIANVERLRLGGPPALASFDAGGAVSSRMSTSVPQVAVGMAGTPQPVTVAMQGEVFNRATLARIIDGLNGMFDNGYKLKIA